MTVLANDSGKRRRGWRCEIASLGLLATTSLVVGCGVLPSNQTSSTAQAPEPASNDVGVYQVGVDDELDIRVWRNEDLSVEIPVRPDGKISVPLIGDVQAAGRTPEEIAAEIEQKLDFYVLEPNVTVIVRELRSNEYMSRVRVTGAVLQPISLPYRRGMTVLDIVLQAGGVNEYAAPDGTKLYRPAGSSTKIIPVKLGKILEKGELSTNVELQPGDVVTVPEGFF